MTPYLLGLKFKLETDHKPLVPLLSTKALDELPPRVLRFRLRLMKFTFDVVHVPGKRLITADALSGAPVKHTFTQEEKDNEAEVKVFVDAVIQSLPVTEARLREFKRNGKRIQFVKNSSDTARQGALPLELGAYWPERETITLPGELLLRGQRIVIPHCKKLSITSTVAIKVLSSAEQEHASLSGGQDCRYISASW